MMVDHCTSRSEQDIAAQVREAFSHAVENAAAPSEESAGAASPRPLLSGPPQEMLDKAHGWTCVARVLCENGGWAKAVAITESLPLPLQHRAMRRALLDHWALPPPLREDWRRLAAQPSLPNMQPRCGPAPVAGERVFGVEDQSTASSAPPPALLRTADILRNAYNLRRSAATASSSSSCSSLSAAQKMEREQVTILEELCCRGSVREAVQCLVNWQRRGLLPPLSRSMTGSSFRSTGHEDTMEQKRDHWSSGEAATSSRIASSSSSLTLQPFYLTEPSRSVAVVASTIFPRLPLHPTAATQYSSTQVAQIMQLLDAAPAIAAHCLCYRSTIDRVLRSGGPSLLYQISLQLLKSIAELPHPPQVDRAAESVSASAQESGTSHRTKAAMVAPSAASVEILWECWPGAAVSLYSIRKDLSGRSKAEKEALLHQLVAALQMTHRCIAATNLDRMGGAASLRAAVESLCSPLLHHAPQVRFIGIEPFGAAAMALQQLGVPLPNALVQCLLLCMGDRTVTTPPNQIAPAAPTTAAEKYLVAAPLDRWKPALAMLQEARALDRFRVTATHLRVLLSGLQSISIVQTWQTALCCVDWMAQQLQIWPDERSLPTLLLNLKQDSWCRAFDVLSYQRRIKEPLACSPMLLRDLHLVALKHASWQLTLRVMDQLVRCRADGLMNYLYSLYAAGKAGDVELSYRYFVGLKQGRGRHAERRGISPYNEVTVAVAAVAMMDAGHYGAMVQFAAMVRRLPSSERCAESLAGPAPALSRDGRYMSDAMSLVGHLFLRREMALVQLLSARPLEEVREVLRTAVLLRSLHQMQHLNAPVRLIFDVLGSKNRQGQQQQQPFLSQVEQEERHLGSYETRQQSAVQRRRPLYIPLQHQLAAKRWMAVSLGEAMQHCESAVSGDLMRTTAEVMMAEGVGAEYLKAALL